MVGEATEHEIKTVNIDAPREWLGPQNGLDRYAIKSKTISFLLKFIIERDEYNAALAISLNEHRPAPPELGIKMINWKFRGSKANPKPHFEVQYRVLNPPVLPVREP